MTLRVLFGVTGGIAAYKACAMVSRLAQRGDRVRVVMTEEATRFVAPATFAALSGEPVTTSLWDRPEAIAHVRLTRDADVFAIAPATAQTLAKLALGLADDALSNAALASRAPLVVAPAMNTAMYEHPATRGHLATLRARGVRVVEPESGFLAERESGPGRLAAEGAVLAAIDAAAGVAGDLAGARVLVTAGPTREAIDPVRFLSNASTGATGLALAARAAARGARVRLVLGPTPLRPPEGIETLRATSAREMYEAALRPDFVPDVVLAAAAVADERPVAYRGRKRKKTEGAPPDLALEPTEDVVAALRAAYPAAFVVGFAAETEAHEANAAAKLAAKGLDAVLVNDVADGRAFGDVENVLTWLGAGGRRVFGPAPKPALAASVVEAVARAYAERAARG